jgi:DNA-binding CsgD family transcriptional regulator
MAVELNAPMAHHLGESLLKLPGGGKTAWEASVILGISERTVRFHLNAAREKLNCATTTQAVAKAVAHQLIDV